MERRKREIADILTPMQFERWQELNRSLMRTQPSLPMPQAGMNDTAVTPIPEMHTDSTHDRMPQLDSVPVVPAPLELPQ
jgi:hypothetical protein